MSTEEIANFFQAVPCHIKIRVARRTNIEITYSSTTGDFDYREYIDSTNDIDEGIRKIRCIVSSQDALEAIVYDNVRRFSPLKNTYIAVLPQGETIPVKGLMVEAKFPHKENGTKSLDCKEFHDHHSFMSSLRTAILILKNTRISEFSDSRTFAEDSDDSDDDDIPELQSDAPEDPKIMVQPTPLVTVKKNAWGNWENADNHIVFDRNTKLVLGNQLPDGTIGDLTRTQRRICELNMWGYDVHIRPLLPIREREENSDDES